MTNNRSAAHWPRHALLAPLALAFLTAWTGGSGDKAGRTSVSGTPATAATSAAVAQPANTNGRLLASNCFQCHGTGGTGGFDKICGSSDLSGELAEYRRKAASQDIMAAHAQGYTQAQIDKVVAYLKQPCTR